MTENRGSESLQEITAHWVLPFMEPQKNLRADMLLDTGKSMGCRGVETPITPDALDANVVPARAWGVWLGVGCVECVGLIDGFW
jgi:hypothetical protein